MPVCGTTGIPAAPARWQIRTAAFQTRYAYSRAALDRGDFAAAAGGFEAILREEPGFLDVPQLLVKARAGLKDVAAGPPLARALGLALLVAGGGAVYFGLALASGAIERSALSALLRRGASTP